MFSNSRSFKPLVLAGIAGAAYFAYTRLSEEQKKNLTDSLMKHGKELLGGLFHAARSGTPDPTPDTEM